MGVLNDRPLLSRADIQRALLPGPGSDLENQVERIRITPDPRPQDEISRMWATFGTGYRLSVSYDAAVVLIDSTRPVAAPAPVLSRGSEDRGPFAHAQLAPQIDLVLPPNGQAAARPGDPVTLHGRHLDAVAEVEVTGIRLAAPTTLAVASVSPEAVVVDVPKPPTLPAGTVAVAARFDDGSGRLITGPAAPLALAPTIVSKSTLKAKLDDTGSATLKVKCAPPVEPGQTLALIVGDQLIVEPPLEKASDELTFTVTGLPAQTYTMRLRVDSVDSIPVAAPAEPNGVAPMQIDPAQQVALT
jgi:hypothetical protein